MSEGVRTSSDGARYQRTEQLRRSGPVTTSRGVDVVTGLGVLIYDFSGPPTTKAGQLTSESIPAVLAAGFDGTRGVLVAAYPQGSAQFDQSGAALDDTLVLQALTALRDAARVNLTHGDITADRLILAHGRLYLEGYGVPWQNTDQGVPSKEVLQAALADDLRSAVRVLLGLGTANMSSEVLSALKGAVASPSRAGDAAQLYSVVRRLAGGAVTVPSAGFGNLVIPTVDGRGTKPPNPESDDLGLGHLNIDLDLDKLDLKPRDVPPLDPIDDLDDPGFPDYSPAAGNPDDSDPALSDLTPVPESTDVVDDALELFDEPPHFDSAPPEFGVGRRDDAILTTPPFPDDPDPIVLQSDPGPTIATDSKLRDSGAGFVKDLPPGATYKAGNVEEDVRVPPMDLNISAVPKRPKRQWRLPLLVAALVLVAGAAGYLALVSSREPPGAVPGTAGISHFVDVRVDPPNLPPVSLIVEQRPAASAYRAGTIIGSVPRRVRFDAAGTWVVRATFQGRVSESVTLNVPGDTVIVIVFPPDEQP